MISHRVPAASWSVWNPLAVGWIKSCSSSGYDHARIGACRRQEWESLGKSDGDEEREQEQVKESSGLDWLKVLWNCTSREKESLSGVLADGLWTKDYTQLPSWKQHLLYTQRVTNFSASWKDSCLSCEQEYFYFFFIRSTIFLGVPKLSSEVRCRRNLHGSCGEKTCPDSAKTLAVLLPQTEQISWMQDLSDPPAPWSLEQRERCWWKVVSKKDSPFPSHTL